MRLPGISACGLAIAASLAVSAAPASAASIVLDNIGGVTPGTAAYDDFQIAAKFWGSMITNNITVNLDVGFVHLGANVLGETSSNQGSALTSTVESLLAADSSHDSVDTAAVSNLPALDNKGGLSVYTLNGDTSGTVPFGATPTLDNNNTANNTKMEITTANAKALGFSVPAGTIDGTIEFSSDFNFDFNPTNGISSNSIDFLGVAIHEIGHALGFISGVDTLDTSTGSFSDQTTVTGSTLDLFRYADTGPGGAAALTWAPGVASYFSVDGGATDLCNFATGATHGDGDQASHWQHDGGSGGSPCGVMDPSLAFGQEASVTNLDFTAFDAIGYNFNFDPLLDPSTLSTSQIFNQFGVPEPSAWVLMILGFGLTGAATRRGRRQTATA